MQVQGASPPASDDEEDPAVGGSGGDTSDTASTTPSTMRPEHTQRRALGQQPATLVRHALSYPDMVTQCLIAALQNNLVHRGASLHCCRSATHRLLLQGNELEVAALKEGEYVAVRRFARLLERGCDAKVQQLPTALRTPLTMC